MEDEKIKCCLKIFTFHYAIDFPNWAIDMGKANGLLKKEHCVKYDPEFSKNTLAIKNEKFTINLMNSGQCMIYSKIENQKEVVDFLLNIRETVFLARIKR